MKKTFCDYCERDLTHKPVAPTAITIESGAVVGSIPVRLPLNFQDMCLGCYATTIRAHLKECEERLKGSGTC